jgi:hypothetical protein
MTYNVIVFNFTEGIIKTGISDLKVKDTFYTYVSGQLYNLANVCLDTQENRKEIESYVKLKREAEQEIDKLALELMNKLRRQVLL